LENTGFKGKHRIWKTQVENTGYINKFLIFIKTHDTGILINHCKKNIIENFLNITK
jgi:hypothetical protein